MKNKSWSSTELSKLKSQYPSCLDVRLLAIELKRSYLAVKTKARVLGLKRIDRKTNRGSTIVKPEDDVFLKENYHLVPAATMGQWLGYSETCIKCRYRQLGIVLTPELSKQFKEMSVFHVGQTPVNKGKTWDEYMSQAGQRASRKTTFKKNNKPHNTQYDGAIRLRRDKTGIPYHYIRISEGKWDPLHRFVWKIFNGPIPEGSVVRFKDGNQHNCNINNLEWISLKDNMLRNSVHNYPKEIAQLVQLRGALNRKIRKHLKSLQ